MYLVHCDENSVLIQSNINTIIDSTLRQENPWGGGEGKSMLNTSPPQIETTGSKDVKKLSGKVLLMNLSFET